MNSLVQDLRFALRMLFKSPIFTLITVVTLALGIGANTAIFSVVDPVLLRPLPYPEANRLVFLWSTMNSQGVSLSGSALPDYHSWRDRNQVFEGLAAFYNGDFNLSSVGSPPELIQGAYITSNLFAVLKISPALGRLFTNEEEQFGRHHVVLLSYELWQRRFAGDRDIVGRQIKLAGESYAVAGVMPKGLPFFDNLPEVELWTPLSFAPNDNMGTRNNHFINLVSRPRTGSPRLRHLDFTLFLLKLTLNERITWQSQRGTAQEGGKDQRSNRFASIRTRSDSLSRPGLRRPLCNLAPPAYVRRRPCENQGRAEGSLGKAEIDCSTS